MTSSLEFSKRVLNRKILRSYFNLSSGDFSCKNNTSYVVFNICSELKSFGIKSIKLLSIIL